jgi:hypothetical protein
VIVSFPLPLETEQINERWHRVLNGFDAVVEEDGKDPIVIHVPHGFVTNFASVPRLPFAYLLVGGRGNRAAVVHDFLYEPPTQHQRSWCDDVFYAGLCAIGEISGEAARAMYVGVRIGGGSHFGKHDPDQPA